MYMYIIPLHCGIVGQFGGRIWESSEHTGPFSSQSGLRRL